MTTTMTTRTEPKTENVAAPSAAASAIPDRLFFRIGDVAELAGVKPYVLRYWETEFPMIAPQKSNTGQRVYRRVDVETVLMIRHLLYEERYSIEGARRRIRELRKAGDLKEFRQQASVPGELVAENETSTQTAPGTAPETTMGAVAESAGVSRSGLPSAATLRAQLLELRELARTPAQRLFVLTLEP